LAKRKDNSIRIKAHSISISLRHCSKTCEVNLYQSKMDIAKLPSPIVGTRGIWEPFTLSVWLFIEFEFNLFLLICHFALPQRCDGNCQCFTI